MAGLSGNECGDLGEERLLLKAGLADDLRKAKKRQIPSSSTVCGYPGEAELTLVCKKTSGK